MINNKSKYKGRVLYIGSSYYINYYLSQSLRQLGWKVDTLVAEGEGAESFLHGGDYYLRDIHIGDQEYPKERLEFLVEVLQAYTQDPDESRIISQIDAFVKRGLRAVLFRFLKRQWLDQVVSVHLREWMKSSLKFPYTLIRQTSLSLLETILAELSVSILQKLVDWLAKEGRLRPELPVKEMVIFLLHIAPDNKLLRKLFLLLLHSTKANHADQLKPLFGILDEYDILHFAGVNSLRLLYFFNPTVFGAMPIEWDIAILKLLGKKIVFSVTGCLDGVSQTSVKSWPGVEPACEACIWRAYPNVCSDKRNLAWGKLRNELSDFICTLGGNRADYNDDPKVHEVPELYCLDSEVWVPNLEIPEKYKLPYPPETIKIYHAVGNFDLRTDKLGKNIKSTHIYLPLIEQLKQEGYPIELVFAKDIPNMEVRFLQSQVDIVVDMLTFGFFGANGREAMMLGKPFVCYLRPAWLESMRTEIPDYVEEIPVVNATPATIHSVLVDLITNHEKRQEIGRRSREFAVKWHSKETAGRRLQEIYSNLLNNEFNQ